MNASPEEIEEAARRLIGAGDRMLLDRMSVLSVLRYGKKEVFAERLAAMTMEEVFQDTYLYQEALDKGEVKGLQKGREKGREEGERQMLTRLLTTRFGPLPAAVSEKIAAAGIESIEAWSVQLLTAKSLEESLR